MWVRLEGAAGGGMGQRALRSALVQV
eukprot:COSAG02_NODE_58336_length_277_cov_1.741573_1_plen_25_part_01